MNLQRFDSFFNRHIGHTGEEIRQMLSVVRASTLNEFIDSVVPSGIRTTSRMDLPSPQSEHEVLDSLSAIIGKNKLFRSLIGMGYYDTITPSVIRRNILENPGWYTQYTPYQSEIAQGRLEALLNFQTMVSDLTSLPISNASLLDEATAAAEVMSMFFAYKGRPEGGSFFVSEACNPQTIAVVRTRAKPLGISVKVGEHSGYAFPKGCFGALVQYPTTDGEIVDYAPFCERAHESGAFVVVAADILALTLLTPPGEFGADAAVGNTQRLGVPLGYGGPHAAYLSAKEEFKRLMPGRIIGVSVDSRGQKALRMALQTREQHIRREKATSNICTAQVLLAVMASMYAVYHGPDGLKAIAQRIHDLTRILALGLKHMGYTLRHDNFFDTVRVDCDGPRRRDIEDSLRSHNINIRWYDDGSAGVSLDEVSEPDEVQTLLACFVPRSAKVPHVGTIASGEQGEYEGRGRRSSPYLQHTVFRSYHSETKMMRYIRSLEVKDLSLTTSMIPLGSCTMKLNAVTELLPLTWPHVNKLHPFVPRDQSEGYAQLLDSLEGFLKEITGFEAISFQPNSGAQGEYTGLLVIRGYHESRGEAHRTVCLIPSSAHGTNPASAVMAGMDVIVVGARGDGSIDITDLRAKAEQHRDKLAALMVTYPSTHGVFEEGIKEICSIIHMNGGLVYMDGANLNAQVGLCRPAELGADVCHLNLHKTFCIPHGGGGPGMGPIGVVGKLIPFLPSHPERPEQQTGGIGSVAAAPYGSPSILPISWIYIAMMGAHGLTEATKVAILNANYMASRLSEYYSIVYRGMNGRVAHEFILDLRGFKESANIEVEDVAKRLMDYGFHAPTTSFPVPGTLMIEPTESESKDELDRFCEAMIAIREEIREIEEGSADRSNNVLKNAPHTSDMIATDNWTFPYARAKAAYPLPWLVHHKFWPSVGRVNNVAGDRNLVCTCPPIEAYGHP